MASPAGLEMLEETVNIDEDGIISHNEEIVQEGGKDDLTLLKSRMKRLVQQGMASRTDIVVTVGSRPDTKYSRVVDVLNALRYAGIQHVRFSASDED